MYNSKRLTTDLKWAWSACNEDLPYRVAAITLYKLELLLQMFLVLSTVPKAQHTYL